MKRVTKLSRNQIAEFAKDPQQIKYFEALQENVSELPDAIAILTAAVAEAQFDADIATTSANEALTLANQKSAEDGDFLPEMVLQPPNGADSISSAVVGAATKATPVDADLLPLADSAAGYTLKNLTWANLKATLKTYFDSVVTTLTNKTIALGSNTISGTLAQFNTAVTDADLASLAGVETLTNKTIALGNNTVSGTLAQFNTAVTDADLASLAGVETLTNKTINLTSNTLVATSAQLAAALTDETGTGAAVFATSPALAGVPTAPTAAAGTNTTQVATTAFAHNLATGPAFSAYQSTLQSITTATFTKVQLQTEEFDTNSNFDSTTNYRFTPTVEKYYLVTGHVTLAADSASLLCSIYKNGVEFKRGTQSGGAANSGSGTHVSALIHMNGSTDYVELFVFQGSGASQNTAATSVLTYFQAHAARAV